MRCDRCMRAAENSSSRLCWGCLRELLGWTAFALLTAFLVACGPAPVRPDPGPVDGDACELAGANMERLRCPGWEGSPGPDEDYATAADNATWAEVCREVEAAAVEAPGASLQPRCRARANSCAEAEACRAQ